MDIGVAMTDAEAAILSQLVGVYIGLRMCTSIRAISERSLLHCWLTSAPGHHALRRCIVEKAIATMHDAIQDDVTNVLHMTVLIALLLDSLDRQRHCINEYAILLVFIATALGGMCEVFFGMVDVACGDAHEVTKQLQSVLLTWISDCDCWAKRVVLFEVDLRWKWRTHMNNNLGLDGGETWPQECLAAQVDHMNVGERSTGHVGQAQLDGVLLHATTLPPRGARPNGSCMGGSPFFCAHPHTG